MRVFESRAQRRLFRSERDEVQENGENYIIRNIINFTLHNILLWSSAHMWKMRNSYKVLEYRKVKDQSGEVDVNWMTILKWALNK